MTIFQGAEAEVEINSEVKKKRKEKKYRHPQLDQKLRKERTKKESKLIKEADRAGANVPDILETEETELKIQKIEGKQLKQKVEDKPELLSAVGENIARLHEADIIHGDLTTSNAIVADQIYLIDFGLASRSQRIEDKAVDIHLLKQVLESSHPDVAEEAWEHFVDGYQKYGDFEEVMERLKEVEQRGRYK